MQRTSRGIVMGIAMVSAAGHCSRYCHGWCCRTLQQVLPWLVQQDIAAGIAMGGAAGHCPGHYHGNTSRKNC